MERRFQTGTVVSAVGHIGVALWVLVGDWLFAADKPPETITMTASTISSDAFAELQAATAKPAEEPAPVRPQARPEPVVEPPPDEPPPEEPPPVEPPPPVEVVPDPVPEPDPVVVPPASDAVQAEEEQTIQSDSTEIQPAPEAEEIIAPDPVQPETDAQTSDTPEPAVSDQPSDVAVEEQPPTEATVAEDTGDVTQTEANQDQTAETGMTTSIRPKSRPERPAAAPEPEVAADTPVEDPPAESNALTVQPVDDTETQDAIDALLGDPIQFIDIFGNHIATRPEALKAWSGEGCEVKSFDIGGAKATMFAPDFGVLTVRAITDGKCFGQDVWPIWGTSLYVKRGNTWLWSFGINVLAGAGSG